jgi:hypothetical protein
MKNILKIILEHFPHEKIVFFFNRLKKILNVEGGKISHCEKLIPFNLVISIFNCSSTFYTLYIFCNKNSKTQKGSFRFFYEIKEIKIEFYYFTSLPHLNL